MKQISKQFRPTKAVRKLPIAAAIKASFHERPIAISGALILKLDTAKASEI